MSKIIFKKEEDLSDMHDIGSITFEFGGSAPIDQVVDQFRHFLLALGYSPKHVEEALGTE